MTSFGHYGHIATKFLNLNTLDLFDVSCQLSSIKWEHDGEMSAQDTWNLVKKLTKVEEQDKASNLLHLSSKHSHSKRPNRR